MEMEKLLSFIESRYTMAYFWANGDIATIDRMCNQAFGALEFFHSAYPDLFDECERLWNEEWHPQFLALKGL